MACNQWSLTPTALLVLAACALGGCRASYLERGAALYAERDYVGADELFEHNESHIASATTAERARYALYRGVTLQSLGDSARSQYWLQVAAGLSHREPDALTVEEHAALKTALKTSDDAVRFAADERTRSASASLVRVSDAQ